MHRRHRHLRPQHGLAGLARHGRFQHHQPLPRIEHGQGILVLQLPVLGIDGLPAGPTGEAELDFRVLPRHRLDAFGGDHACRLALGERLFQRLLGNAENDAETAR